MVLDRDGLLDETAHLEAPGAQGAYSLTGVHQELPGLGAAGPHSWLLRNRVKR
jgi:hypothetical protein